MSNANLPRIKKVLVLRYEATSETGILSEQSETLMEETTIAAAKAGVQNYFRIIEAGNRLVRDGKTAAEHYPQYIRCHVPAEENEENVEVWDVYLREDFWFSIDAVLQERIYIKVVR
jgi:hypothetical protein